MVLNYLLSTIVAVNIQAAHLVPDETTKLEITEGKLIINDVEMDPKWKLSNFEKALGESYRTDGSLYVFDKKGFVCWPSYEENGVTEFKVILMNDPELKGETYLPKSLFRGSITIQGYQVHINTSLTSMLNNLSQYDLTSNRIGSYDGTYAGIYFFARFDQSQKHLIWLAIGIDDEDSYD